MIESTFVGARSTLAGRITIVGIDSEVVFVRPNVNRVTTHLGRAFPANSPIEFTAVECTGESMAAEVEIVSVSSKIIGLGDGGKEVTFMAMEAEKMGEISGSRTALMIDGAEAKRDALTLGMECEFTYEDGAEIEFKTVTCGETAMMVTSAILGLEDRNKQVTFNDGSGEKMGEISGSRTALTIDGAEAERDALTVGMNCDFTYEAGAEIEFKSATCRSN